jgi:hypothetical protein
MAKINRYTGDLKAFASNSTGTNRTVFGDVVQSDTLDDNVNPDYFLGWEIVGVNDKPDKEDFNALGFTLGQIHAYIHQMGVPEWDASQEYPTEGAQVVHSLSGWKRGPDWVIGDEPGVADSTRWTKNLNISDLDDYARKDGTIFTGPVLFDVISDIASASSLDLTAFGSGTLATVTGTTETTSITMSNGQFIRLKASAAWSITASASLIVDGNTSGTYSVPSGTIITVMYDGSEVNVLRNTGYIKPTAWTASFTCASPGDLSVGSASQSCFYSVTGDVATINLNFSASISYTTASGLIRVTGVPVGIAPPDNQVTGSLSWGGISAGAGWTQYGVQMNADSDIYLVRSGNGLSRTNVDITDIVSGANIELACTFQVMLTPS